MEQLIKFNNDISINNLEIINDFPNLKNLINLSLKELEFLKFKDQKKLKIKIYNINFPIKIQFDYLKNFETFDRDTHNIEFVLDEDSDLNILIDGIYPTDILKIQDYSKSILIINTPEKFRNKFPEEWRGNFKNFLKVISFEDNLKLGNCYLPKVLNNYNIEKQDKISVIIDPNYNLIGNTYKVDFAKFLEMKEIDINAFGSKKFYFKNYKSDLNLFNQSLGIFPYKYCLISDSNETPNIFSSNILDCIICETLPIYYGCCNIERWIDKNCFIRLELSDFEKDYKKVKKIIDEDEYSKRIKIIKKEKERILKNYNLYQQIKSILENLNKF